jgi:hypothetical protein
MVDERLRVANIAGNGTRPHVENAHRLEVFPLVSIGGNSSAGVAPLIIGELAAAVASHGSCGASRRVHRWRRQSSVRRAGRYRG